MIRSALLYLTVFAVITSALIVVRARITPAVVFLPLLIWPDVTLLCGLGKMERRASIACRMMGLAAFFVSLLAKVLRW
jgi:hypothetical protein